MRAARGIYLSKRPLCTLSTSGGLSTGDENVAQWLRSLGLTQYEQAFRDNAVDADTLPRLTSGDLKELGVRAVGHRRKLLDAIASRRLTRMMPSEPSGPGWP